MKILLEIVLILAGIYLCYAGIKKQLTDNTHVNTVVIFVGVWLIAVAGYLMIPR